MTTDQQVDYILPDCFFAVGQAVGTRKQIDYDAIAWLRQHYHEKFVTAIDVSHNSWDDDRDRVMAVSRWLGQRAMAYAGSCVSIDASSAAKAAAEIEAGCAMSKRVM